MENIEEKAALCALNRIFGFEPKIGIALIEHFGSALEVMKLSEPEKSLLLGQFPKYTDLMNTRQVEQSIRELEHLQKNGATFIGITENDYPHLLKNCEDPPIGIYIKSSSKPALIFKSDVNVSIVGTRDISLYGEEWCRKTVKALSQTIEKPTIVSGLALGTDICAHKAAIDFGLPTIGVMATGIDRIYPWKHRDAAELIAATPGCALISDYPPGTAPLAVHFLRRNRIIAALGHSTILVESKVKGGGMTTSRLAFSYGREVYAIPGRIDDIRSGGCNLLIKNKIAEPLTSENDIVSNLRLNRLPQHNKPSDYQDCLNTAYTSSVHCGKIGQMAEILMAIRQNRGISIEEIACITRLDYSRVAELTNILETDGFISIDLLQRCRINIRK